MSTPKSSRTIAENRRAGFDVAIEQSFEAGLLLTGDEIKSIRAHRAQLNGAYIKFLAGRPILVGMHLSAAKDPERIRPLLLNESEILEIDALLQTKGKAAVPLRLYLKGGWAKVQVGIGSGRKTRDKRSLLRERDIARDMEGEIKRRA